MESECKSKEMSTNNCLLNQGRCGNVATTQVKRKTRSTRRRLNALMNNTSLHFSDTDSEGELTIINPIGKNNTFTKVNSDSQNIPNPVVSVTVDGVEYQEPEYVHQEHLYLTKERRSSFVDNLTDVDEIYTSDVETQDAVKVNPIKNSLNVMFNGHQGETDVEDLAYEDGEEPGPICVEARSDIFTDFNGETITTKEGDGPFSVEVRNQICTAREQEVISKMPDIIVMPTTDSEDMDASDEDEEEGACGLQEEIVLDGLATSQIVMKNLNKMDNLLNVAKDVSDDGISDSHTDVEDLE
ncbi:uncharacterized protein LOC127278972 [Leptopilina boulardi]|uniref:uncharacterized protein LOC127278972 n=1 Tax=Leptopilina boulardi TaxID=63433 RepID=UPI0021F53251|nr:uncharacterized protein LOC127278972 [Leptopilina boulardi]